MSSFKTGGRVLLLRPRRALKKADVYVKHLFGTVQVLAERVPPPHRSPDVAACWVLQRVRNARGWPVAWHEALMIPLDPDEAPEESAEAMRELHDTTNLTKETA